MPPRTQRPLHQQLVVTLYGLYGGKTGGSFRVAALVAMLADLGIDEQAARSTVSRLKSKGILLSQRDDGVARYALSGDVLDIFDSDDKPIFAPERSKPGDPWSLVVFSVPEAERNRRYELRAELTSLGFGFVAAGVAIAPSTAMDQAMKRLAERGLDRYAEYFSGDYLKCGDIRGQVSQWWDLELLDRQYSDFIDSYEALARPWQERAQAGQPLSAADRLDAFRTYVPMLTLWRKFPYRDPNLPLEYLPAGWQAPRAKQAFLTLHGILRAPAEAHADDLLRSRGA
ncbi:transcriptional regulator, PaaX-like protein family [Arthrobacter crystallopoietes BAB-32]|uniref:Transcriptional regulator, PaaX-like protein family n=1 Tax=Arthrobacter crystallopoietes BAB-32 TaxID=1246476 RepID=N1V4I1_9MICC|nr:PaaX family transcriptional regulator C-terminal domain-containing protein [Arthrobacter crystallopoietes]EMY33153.1 transcriptional regulator, PaaX-like protein family [Arthrobacter crystallopoietes BAB-32]